MADSKTTRQLTVAIYKLCTTLNLCISTIIQEKIFGWSVNPQLKNKDWTYFLNFSI